MSHTTPAFLDDPHLDRQPSGPNIASFLPLFCEAEADEARVLQLLGRLSELLVEHPDVSPLWAAAWGQAGKSQARSDVKLFTELTRGGLQNLGTWIHSSTALSAYLMADVARSHDALEHVFFQAKQEAASQPLLPLVQQLRVLLRVQKFKISCKEILAARAMNLRSRRQIPTSQEIFSPIFLEYPNFARITEDQLSRYMKGGRQPDIFDIGMSR